jgi:hypothetical protein
MTRTTFAILMASLAGVVLLAMLVAWRSRARHGMIAMPVMAAPNGEVLAHFQKVSYVSTTPVGSPFERVVIQGLRFKGNAELTVRRDAVTIAVAGEAPVHIPSKDVLQSATASGRVGKFVERDGLSLLVWRAPASQPPHEVPKELESSFRFAEPSEQAAFAEAINAISHNTTQEDV